MSGLVTARSLRSPAISSLQFVRTLDLAELHPDQLAQTEPRWAVCARRVGRARSARVRGASCTRCCLILRDTQFRTTVAASRLKPGKRFESFASLSQGIMVGAEHVLALGALHVPVARRERVGVARLLAREGGRALTGSASARTRPCALAQTTKCLESPTDSSHSVLSCPDMGVLTRIRRGCGVEVGRGATQDMPQHQGAGAAEIGAFDRRGESVRPCRGTKCEPRPPSMTLTGSRFSVRTD